MTKKFDMIKDIDWKGKLWNLLSECRFVVCWIMGFQTKYGDGYDRSKGNVSFHCLYALYILYFRKKIFNVICM